MNFLPSNLGPAY